VAARPRGHKLRKLNAMFIHFFCLCPPSLTIKPNPNISKVAYYSICLQLSAYNDLGSLYVTCEILPLLADQLPGGNIFALANCKCGTKNNHDREKEKSNPKTHVMFNIKTLDLLSVYIPTNSFSLIKHSHHIRFTRLQAYRFLPAFL